MTEETDEEAQRVLDALDDVESMTDEIARARAISQLLKDQKKRNPRLKEHRDETVRNLRAQGDSLRSIANQVGLSLGTVQDILRGHTGTWADRRKKKEAGGTSPEE